MKFALKMSSQIMTSNTMVYCTNKIVKMLREKVKRNDVHLSCPDHQQGGLGEAYI